MVGQHKKNQFIFFLILLLILLSKTKLQAQQNYIFANYKPYVNFYNPASIASLEGYNVAMLGRQQWAIAGAPQSFLFNFTGMLDKKNIGFGLSMSKDKAGPENSFGISVDGVYRIPFTFTTGIAFGIKAGAKRQWLDQSILEDSPRLAMINGDFQPDFGAGIYAYLKDFHFGVSLPSFYSQEKVNDEYVNKSFENLSYYIIAGGHFNLSPFVFVDTDVLVQLNQNLPTVIDLSAMLSIHDRIKAGLGYRTNGLAYLKTQFGILRNVYVGYALETKIGGLGRELGNSHELMFSYRFYGRGGPRYHDAGKHRPRFNF